jgi:hypothetical protein
VAVAWVFRGKGKAPGGPAWARVGHELGQHGKIPRKNENGLQTRFGPKSRMGCIKTSLNFKQRFWFKNYGFKYFEDFSNLEHLKISFNIQIQTKA